MDDLLGEQPSFWSKDGVKTARHPDCLLSDFLDENDSACVNLHPSNYEVLECGTEKGLQYINDCRGLHFDNISANQIDIPQLPLYIPSVTKGSNYILKKTNLPWVAITLEDIISPKKLLVADDIRKRIGVPINTKILLQNYGSDPFIEKIWPERHLILPQIANLDVDLMTGFDYSVFWDQPHLERLVNIKRNLITFDILQKKSATVVPHVYWSGESDIERWAEWLTKNPQVKLIAMYWGLFKRRSYWEKQLKYLEYFIKQTGGSIQLIISGLNDPEKISQVKKIVPTLSVVNGSAARLANNYRAYDRKLISDQHPQDTFIQNVKYFSGLLTNKEKLHITEHILKFEMLSIKKTNRLHLTKSKNKSVKKTNLINLGKLSKTNNSYIKGAQYAKENRQKLE